MKVWSIIQNPQEIRTIPSKILFLLHHRSCRPHCRHSQHGVRRPAFSRQRIVPVPIQRLALLTLAAVLLLLTACGSDSPQMVIATQDGITIYNGTDQQICHVADGEQRELHISVSRQSGSISISVLQTEGQKYAYRGTSIPTSDFLVSLTEPGEYRIEIHAENFQGSYDISDSRK